MADINDLVAAIELHAVEDITKCFVQGINPNDYFRGEPLLYELTSEYTRTPRFKYCVKAFVDHGLEFDDKSLLAVLLEDPSSLQLSITNDIEVVTRKYTLRCAYTPLYKATLLHICAEFNHYQCADVLIRNGADVNAKAGLDENGFGGQTPLFHTVNQNGNQSREVMDLLLSKGADLSITVAGLLWGKGYEWETLIPSVNPISYAMMGLLPQMHRDEMTISKVVTTLLRRQYGIVYEPENVPCAYLR